MTQQRTIIERILYNRQLHDNGRVINVAVQTDPDAAIIISSSQDGMGQTGVAIAAIEGADLIVAMSSIYTAAANGREATARVGNAKISSIKIEGVWAVQLSNNATAFVLDLELMAKTLGTTQIVLNDVVGEYRRQVAQIEADRVMAQASYSAAQEQPVVEEVAPVDESTITELTDEEEDRMEFPDERIDDNSPSLPIHPDAEVVEDLLADADWVANRARKSAK